ncbi:MAG: hypothetical protein K2L07_07695 [Lachnospiraceae bacterium]|nr:hypothetical protein [Lachnospiraceae bacterium]
MMQNWYRIKKKRIVYGMIVLLFANLLSDSCEGYMVFAGSMTDGVMFQTDTNPLVYTADCKTGNVVVNSEGVSVIYSKDKAVIEYEIETDGVYTELHSKVESKNDSGGVDGIVKNDATLELVKGKDAFHKTAGECFELGKNNFLEGAYTLTYWLQDASGEHKLEEKTVDFILDETKPVITTMLEEKDVTADGVTRHQVLYKVDSTEINYETCDITVYVARKTMDDERKAEPYLTYRPEGNVDFEKTITFTEDGIYEVYVMAMDAAGNEASEENQEREVCNIIGRKTFEIDNLAPELFLDGIENGKHYREIKSLSFIYKDLTVDANDLNKPYIDDEDAFYKITVERAGSEPKVYVTDKWVADKDAAVKNQSITTCVFGSNQTNQNVFGQDGTYQVTFEGRDAHGNVAEPQSVTFVIDRMKPAIAISSLCVHHSEGTGEPLVYAEDPDGDGISKAVYYLNETGAVSFEVSERNYLTAKAYINTTFHPEKFVSGEPTSEENEESTKEFNLTGHLCTLSKDDYAKEGCYVAKIWAKDAAGNYTGKVMDEEGNPTDTVDPDYIRYFVVDKTAPRFTVRGISAGNGYCLEPAVTIVSNEVNPDFCTYRICVTWIDQKGQIHKRQYPEEGQAPEAGWQKTGVSEYSRTLTFLDGNNMTVEGNYTVTMEGKDKAGNVGNVAKASFRVDTTAPEIELSEVKGIYNSSVPVSISVTELNSADSKVRMQVIRKVGGEVKEHTTEELSLNAKELITVFNRVFSEEGDYTVAVMAEDGAGNVSEGKETHFTIDVTAPVLSIKGISDRYMTKDSVRISLNAGDYNHAISKYKITVVRSDIDGELERTVKMYPESEWQKNGFAVEKELSFTEEGLYEVIFEGVDRAGNEAAAKWIHFTIDRTAPVISGVVYSNQNGILKEKYHNIYSNKSILVEFSVKDQGAGVNDQKVYVTVKGPGEKDARVYIAHRSVGNVYYAYVPADLSLTEFNGQITIWANDRLNNESSSLSANLVFHTSKPSVRMECDADYTKWTNQNVSFDTTVSDEKSGLKEVIYKIDNKTVKRVTFKELTTSYSYELIARDSADKVTGYTLSVEVTNNCGTTNTALRRVYIDKVKPVVTLSGIWNGYHYNSDPVFTAEIKDVSYKETKTVFKITRTLDGKEYPVSAAVFHSGRYEDSDSRKVIKEGKYKIYAVTTDGAGNKSTSNTLEFVVDKTAPRLFMSGVNSGMMSSSAVEVKFGCEESFYAENQVSVKVERELDGKIVREELSGFPKSGRNSSMSHVFFEDGTYEIQISATDKAGNTAIPQTIVFSVDQTKPEIRIAGTDNYEQWKEPATVQFIVEESYYAKSRVWMKGTRTDIDGNVTEIEVPDFVSTGRVSRLIQLFDRDGIYEFEVTAKDAAGNWESKKIHFTIDQTSPEIHNVKQYDGGYYQKFKLADSLAGVFKDLTVVSYRILLNGIEYDGVTPVEEEGKYTLEIEAADELGHLTNQTVEFIIDHTMPKVIFSGIKDGETVHDSGMITVATENPEDKITDVRMNGIHYGSDIESLPYTEYGTYRIEVDCVDKAGNCITGSLHFVYSNPATDVVIFGGMGIMVVSTCMWLWLRNKKVK